MIDDGSSALEGLLGDLTGAMRAGRARLVRELVDQGHTVDELRVAIDDDRLVVLAMEGALREMAPLTAREVAETTGTDIDRVRQVQRLLGLQVVGDDEPAFDHEACAAMATLGLAQEFGISRGGADQVVVALGRHLWELASDVMIVVGDELARPGDTEYELSERYATAARVLAPAAAPLVSSAFQAHLRARMTEIFVTPQDASAGSLRATRDMTVAFVDVVGFTDLGERVEAGDLKSLAMRLVDHATAVVEPPVRLVKTVGDAILLMSRESAPLIDGVVALLRSWEGDDDVPPVHTGVARGTTYVGGADVYGASVNLASRVTDCAPAGAVWATRAVVEDAARHRFAPRGSRVVKGATEPVEIFELDRS